MKTIIGVMGPGNKATPSEMERAYELGVLIARENWILLTGGRNKGVMEEASRGARNENGLTLGILPTSDKTDISPYIDIPVITGMGNARNAINILSSDVIVICGIGPGTLSEVALAIKSKKTIICFGLEKKWTDLLIDLDPNLFRTSSAQDCINIIKENIL